VVVCALESSFGFVLFNYRLFVTLQNFVSLVYFGFVIHCKKEEKRKRNEKHSLCYKIQSNKN